MTLEENEFILESAKLLERWENTPKLRIGDFADMTREEMAKLLVHLFEERDRDRKESSAKIGELTSKVAELTEMLKVSNEHTADANKRLLEILGILKEKEQKIEEKDRKIEELTVLVAKLQSANGVNKRERFGSRSQKTKKGDDENLPTAHTDVKGDFDGTKESIPENLDVDANEGANVEQATETKTVEEKEIRFSRRGVKYNKMKTKVVVVHKSDKTLIPEGAEFIRIGHHRVIDQITKIIQHDYEYVVYKDKDGIMRKGYFPPKKRERMLKTMVNNVPGTHASPSFMAYLAYNHFFLNTPVCREVQRLTDEEMKAVRQTLHNWLEKGANYIKYVIDHLKDTCLEKDSIVNCDETWCRVKMKGKYKKGYIWCLVNKRSRTVIYCYEDGSRGRQVLKDILGDSKIKALQTDGYSVYLYLDKEVYDIDHICCMAHMRAKFKYADEIEKDPYAKEFLRLIGKLYALEERYEKQRLSPEQIKYFRNSPETTAIIIELRSLLDMMKAEGAPRCGDLMQKALNYLDHYWTQIFRYREDGEYTIDNTLAERFIRPLANERKNSLFFGSHKMARVSAAYHSVLSTCKYQGYSILEYLKRFFTEIAAGNRDYGQLLPSTIGISVNNI